MPGLDPGIQPTYPPLVKWQFSLDGRVKPGHDGRKQPPRISPVDFPCLNFARRAVVEHHKPGSLVSLLKSGGLT